MSLFCSFFLVKVLTPITGLQNSRRCDLIGLLWGKTIRKKMTILCNALQGGKGLKKSETPF